MTYIVQSTERNNKKASDYETKGMLYLMCNHKDAEEMFYFVIDFFNDVTAVHRLGHKAWDLQSKGERKLTATKLGKYLVTLYKNYLSDLDFSSYILFVEGISSTSLLDQDAKIFSIKNFDDKNKERIMRSLKDKAKDVSYIDSSMITDENILDFLSKVTFVINDKEKHEYIKQIIQQKSSLMVEDGFLAKIFDEIRDKQTVKKSIYTEGMKIDKLIDFFPTKKYITYNEIILLILSRLIHKDNIIKQGAPVCFVQSLSNLGKTDEEIKELVEDCEQDISRMLFDKNNASNYWDLFFNIYDTIKSNPKLSVMEIYNYLGVEKFESVNFLTFNSAQYFIALIKDGVLT